MATTTQFTFHDAYGKKAEDINDAFAFADRIHQLAEHPSPRGTGALWFRGQADGSWPLLPSIGRKSPFWLKLSLPGASSLPGNPYQIAEVEYNLLNRFRRHAHAFLKREPTLWESITMAQHYGLPTRLMDWTSNPLVALYFAAESHDDKDGAMFAFRPSKLWKSHVNVYDDASPVHKHEADPLTVKGVRIIYPMMSSERLVAQSGGFTVQNPWTPLESQSGLKFNANHLEIVEIYKWKLPKDRKLPVVSQLNRAGISHRSLFPDLGGIAVGLLRAELLRKHGGSRSFRMSSGPRRSP